MTLSALRPALAAALALAPVVAPLAATAQEATPSGAFELEYLRSEGASDTFLDGDVNLSVRGLGGGGMGLGFDLGVDTTFNLSEGEDRTAFYGAAVFSLGFGEVAVGAPRGIGDTLITLPSFAGMKAVDEVVSFAMPPAAGSLSKQGDRQSFGIRYEGQANALRYGASVQKLRGRDGMFLQAAGEFAFNGGVVEGMLEHDTDRGGLSALVGVAATAGQVDFGIYLGHQEVAVKGTGFRASVDYNVTDSIKLGGDFARIDVAGDERDLYGIGAEYGFGNGAYGQVGVADGEDTSAMWDVSVGFEF